MIPCANPRAQYFVRKDDIDDAIERVLNGGQYILGAEVTAFEAEFAAYIGVAYGIGAGSGTEALHLALRTCGIGPGDEVLTVSHTAVATVAAIELTGARPVFVDIDPSTYTMDPDCLHTAITSATKAVIPVHLYGHPAPMDRIAEIAHAHSLYLIEDCAQAHGASYTGCRVGSFGDMACFSFYPTKNLSAIGDGGMVVTGNTELAQKARRLREYGWIERFISHESGWNTRLDELQAAVLRVKLKFLDQDNRARATLANLYRQSLHDLPLTLPHVEQNATHAYHLFVIRVQERDRMLEYLRNRRIHAAVHYPVPIHRQPAYAALGGELPHTERTTQEILSLPMYPELTQDEVKTVVNAVRAFFN